MMTPASSRRAAFLDALRAALAAAERAALACDAFDVAFEAGSPDDARLAMDADEFVAHASAAMEAVSAEAFDAAFDL